MSTNQVLQGNEPVGPQPRPQKLLERYINKLATLEYQVEALQDVIEQKDERIAELEARVEKYEEPTEQNTTEG